MRKLFAGLLLLAMAVPALGAGLAVSNAWIRLLPGDLPLAGYLHLVNTSGHDLTLVSADSPDFNQVMFHRSMRRDGMDQMIHLDRITLPKGGELTFAPGGYHLMLMGRRHPLARGQHVKITLHFQDGGAQTVEFVVRGASGA